jgi:hypothetical protein
MAGLTFVMRRHVLLLILAMWLLGIVFGVSVGIRGWNALLANRDFASFWVAGKLARAGDAALAYDLNSLRAAASLWLGTTSEVAFPYPPHSLLFAVPLSLIPYKLSFWLWQALSAALFYIAARPFLPNGFPKILAVLTPAALISVAFGQVGLFYGALWLFAFSGSTIASAVLTFKPHLGLLVAVEVIRKRRLVSTVVAAMVLILLSLLIFAVNAWSASLFGAATKQVEMLASNQMTRWPMQMTTPLLAYGIAGWALFAIAAALLLRRNFHVFSAATATFLISPYGFHYDMTVVSLGFGLLLYERWEAMPVWQRLACVLAFLSPGLVAVGTWIVPPLLLAGLYVQCLHPDRSNPDIKDSSGERIGDEAASPVPAS